MTQLRNDVAMLTKDQRLIVMVEHQSTLSENRTLRFLLYDLELLKIHMVERQLNIFSRRAVDLPSPEFYVVYNGKEPLENQALSFSIHFSEASGFLQAESKIVDIRYDHLPPTMKERRDALEGYSFLMDRIRHHHLVDKQGPSRGH